MSFIEAFFGSTQSQFTAYAIFAAVVSICISIILTGTDLTIGNRFLLIFFVILAVLPSILLMLLQITCMVTGGNKNDHWWCWLYSWVIAIFVIIYCILVVIISLSSLFTYNNAISKVDMTEQNNKMSPESSNNYAKMMIQTNSKEEIEKFMNANEEDEENQISNDIDLIQNFTNSSNLNPPPSKSKEQRSTDVESPPVAKTPPMSSNMQLPKPDTDVKMPVEQSSKMVDDEPEPFTNYSYASYS